jgi:hypothetical protein
LGIVQARKEGRRVVYSFDSLWQFHRELRALLKAINVCWPEWSVYTDLKNAGFDPGPDNDFHSLDLAFFNYVMKMEGEEIWSFGSQAVRGGWSYSSIGEQIGEL